MAAYEAELARFASLCHGWRPAGVAADAPVSPSAPKVVSVMLQEWDGAASAPPQNHPHRLLAGQAHIVESMCGGLRFCISPGAFFQVNTPGADVLYGMVRNLAVHGAAGAEMPPVFAPHVASGDADAAGSSSSSGAGAGASSHTAVAAATTALADVCCGTGTIGLACARDFARVVGVELSSEAIDDAKRNASLNGIGNAVFLCERAENVMKDVLDRASAPLPGSSASGASGAHGASAAPAGAGAGAGGAGADAASPAAAAGPEEAAGAAAVAAPAAAPPATATAPAAAAVTVQRVVAIVDPPRGGLHASVIKALRTSRHVKRLVYVSCNPSGTFIDDAVKLCTLQEANSAFARGPAFRPVLAAPMDMFPQTAHTELVCLFERD